MNEQCGDNRFELIKKYKDKLIESTSIETSPEEMSVLDNILFRMWQMDWLDELESIDENLAHLAKIKKALEIIKTFFKGRFSLQEREYVKDEQGNCGHVYFMCFDDKDSHIRYPITQEEYEALKEVLRDE